MYSFVERREERQKKKVPAPHLGAEKLKANDPWLEDPRLVHVAMQCYVTVSKLEGL